MVGVNHLLQRPNQYIRTSVLKENGPLSECTIASSARTTLNQILRMHSR